MACRNGGIVSIIGVYGGLMDKFPIGALMNRGLTIRTGQCHVQRYMRRCCSASEDGEIDPSFVVTHEMTLDDAPRGLRHLQAQGGRVLEGRHEAVGALQTTTDCLEAVGSRHKSARPGSNR